jgi:hypothetical protein
MGPHNMDKSVNIAILKNAGDDRSEVGSVVDNDNDLSNEFPEQCTSHIKDKDTVTLRSRILL